MLDEPNRRTLLQTLVGSLLLGAHASAAEIPDAVLSKADGRLDSQPFGDLRVFLEGQTVGLKSLTVGSLELKPGQSPHPPHQHPEEEIMLITDGHGEITLDAKVTKVGAGSIMYAGSNRVHGIVNTSESSLTFYYFKWLGK